MFVDEYQDVNPAQVRLLEAWLGDNTDLCVVGDPDQAIYSWNGSDPRALVEFPASHPGCEVVRLDMNYRSSEAVLAVASSVLKTDPVAFSAQGRSELASHSPVALASACQRPGVQSQPVVAYETDADEAHGVVTALRRARNPGASWSSLAVLARTNAQLLLFERELESAGVPFRSGGGRAFLARPSVRLALDRLTGQATTSNFRTWVEDLATPAPSADPEPDLSETTVTGEASTARGDDDLDELGTLALEYLRSDSNPNGDGFVTWLEASLRSDPPRQAGEAVDLMTFHRAKGLEWRVVFLTGLEEGLVPIAHARSREAIAEERRLLYVACTRAMDELRCSWARERSFGGRRSPRKPSPYLAVIEATYRDLAGLAEVTPERALASQQKVRALLAGRERAPRDQ